MEHEFHKCWNSDCSVCRKKSRYCEICKGRDSTLTTECVGRKITGLEAGLISEGHIDFKNGDWVIQDKEDKPRNTMIHPESIPTIYRGTHGC